MILIGYIPVEKLEFITDEDERREKVWEVYHASMREILAPLEEAGRRGVDMLCADGRVRHVHPILAAHMADFEEQCMLASSQKTRCPTCVVPMDERGEFIHSQLRTRMQTLKALAHERRGYSFTRENLGLRPTLPFWAKLPFANGHMSAVPDLLHQMHKGMFKDHLVDRWAHIMGAATLDRHLMGLPRYSGLRHFKRGISTFEQWTGNESKTLAKVFLPTVAGITPRKAVGAARCLIDFMYRAHLPQVSEDDLEVLESELAEFHEMKDIFVTKGAITTKHGWNDIPKLHMLIHYAHMIREYGTTDGFNTESSERLHIDYVKLGYRASNKVDPIRQMITHLQQREAWAMLRQKLEDEGVIARRKRGWRPSDDFDDDSRDGGGNTRDQADEGAEEDAEEDTEEDGETEEVNGDRSKQRHWDRVGDHHVYRPYPTISIAKRPPKPRVTAERIVNLHGATDFVAAVQDYVSKLPNAQHHARLISKRSLFAVWTRCHLTHDPLPFAPLVGRQVDCVRARPPALYHPLRSSRSAAFDTVLLEADRNAHGPTRTFSFSFSPLFPLSTHLLMIHCPYRLLRCARARNIPAPPVLPAIYHSTARLCRAFYSFHAIGQNPPAPPFPNKTRHRRRPAHYQGCPVVHSPHGVSPIPPVRVA
jgi:hypothetical protein